MGLRRKYFMSANFEEQIRTEVLALGPSAQQRVLEFVRSVRKSDARKPQTGLASLAGAISQTDIVAMQAAIEQGCEQVKGLERLHW